MSLPNWVPPRKAPPDFGRWRPRFSFNCVFLTLGNFSLRPKLSSVMIRGIFMKKLALAVAAVLALLSIAGCGTGVGKGKAPPPVVTKG